MHHILCDAHGEFVDEGTEFSIQLPANVGVIIYAGPGCAVAQEVPDFLRANVGRLGDDGESIAATFRSKTRLIGRTSKGFSEDTKAPSGLAEFPRYYPPNSFVPNLQLEGDATLSASGVYRWPNPGGLPLGPGNLATMHALPTGNKVRLKVIVQWAVALGGSVLIHWVSCASDHSHSHSNSAGYGFKLVLQSGFVTYA